MQERLLTLEEVCEDIHEKPEEIGKFKRLTRNEGYYISNFRNGRGFDLEDTKIKLKMSFDGAHQPTSMGFFKSKKGYNSKYKCTNKVYANHIGEYVASIILKQLGKLACKVDLGYTTITNQYSGKEIEIEGCLSHSQLGKHEMMLPASVVIEDYKTLSPRKYRELTERGKTGSDKNYTNVEIILAAFEAKYRKSGQAGKIPEMRKAFFDMCAFDLLFGNRDRHDDNFGLKFDQITGELSFYHLFDDEQILGLQERKAAADACLRSDKEYQKFKESELTSCIGIPGKTQQIQSTELLIYLLEKYPKEITDSLKDISRYKLSDLEDLLGRVENLSDSHKSFAKKIFQDRQKEIWEIVEEYQKPKAKIARPDDDEVSL